MRIRSTAANLPVPPRVDCQGDIYPSAVRQPDAVSCPRRHLIGDPGLRKT